MDAPLNATLARLLPALRVAREPWWIIGSTAVVLHGAETSVADIDVLCAGEADARAALSALGGEVLAADRDAVFRSSVFGRAAATPLPVEVMAGLSVRGEALRLVTREWREVGGVSVPVPSRTELVALLRQFGREKDLARADLLSSSSRT